MNIGIGGDFAVWLGTLVQDINRPIVFVADEGSEEEVVLRCSRVGYDNVVGYLNGGFDAWKSAGEKVDSINSISAEEFASRIGERTILDVRKPGEFEAEHVEKAETFPLDFINSNLNQLDKKKEYFVHCAGGYRSMIASSIMKANGINNIVEVAGGMNAILKTKAPVTAYVCPSTL